MFRSWRPQDCESRTMSAICYDHYRLNPGEALSGAIKGICVSGLMTYTFYRSIPVFLFLAPAGVLIGLVRERKERKEKRKQELSMQFKEGIMILAASLRAGYSIENAMLSGVRELTTLYGKDGWITAEFSWMVQQIRMNRTVEDVLGDFADRSGIEDIRSFAEVFAVAKRSSGDIGTVMRSTAEHIREKMQVREEIMTITASRKFEQKIMNLVPFFLVFYVERASPGFFDQMYETTLGHILMSVCLVMYLVSYVSAEKILAIEI